LAHEFLLYLSLFFLQLSQSEINRFVGSFMSHLCVESERENVNWIKNGIGSDWILFNMDSVLVHLNQVTLESIKEKSQQLMTTLVGHY